MKRSSAFMRADSRRRAASIIQSVIDGDDDLSIGVDFGAQQGVVREQVEQLVLQLAREITLLLEETTSPRPRVGVCVIVTRQGKVLLGKRKGSHGAGEYATPGGHLEHLESFQACAAREVLEETGVTIGPTRFLRVLNSTQYAPRHYVDIALAAEWISGEPSVREADKTEGWAWYDPGSLPSPLFAMIPSAVSALLDKRLVFTDAT